MTRASRFDRVRPRAGGAETVVPLTHDAEGKRALFSSTEADRLVTRSGIAIDCARCGAHTLLTPAAALRAAFPAFHLSVVVRRGDKETNVGLLRRHYGSWLRCPACGRGSWVRLTVRL